MCSRFIQWGCLCQSIYPLHSSAVINIIIYEGRPYQLQFFYSINNYSPPLTFRLKLKSLTSKITLIRGRILERVLTIASAGAWLRHSEAAAQRRQTFSLTALVSLAMTHPFFHRPGKLWHLSKRSKTSRITPNEWKTCWDTKPVQWQQRALISKTLGRLGKKRQTS